MIESETVFHAGELAVQARAGVRELARRVGRGMRATIPTTAQAFLREQPFAVVATVDRRGDVWASPLVGAPGFLTPLDERTLRIAATPTAGDPLRANLHDGGALGLLAIEFASRRRMRLNGTLELPADGRILVHARQVYANCPKYIQRREWIESTSANEASTAWQGDALTASQQGWIERADTFFVASAHPAAGADASHRGGNPGFVRVPDSRRLLFPDYAGNNMFNTLGNLAAYPRAGLLFVDFVRGDTLQLTGEAAVHWEGEVVKRFPGAERVLALQVTRVVAVAGAVPLRARLLDYSPFNPSA